MTFPREGDQSPNKIAADIVFVIKDKPHKDFKREGSDLRHVAHIALRDALCGTTVSGVWSRAKLTADPSTDDRGEDDTAAPHGHHRAEHVPAHQRRGLARA